MSNGGGNSDVPS
jgi:hypothetical protein